MKEFALTLNLRDDAGAIEQYKQHHGNVWPEVLACLRSIGIAKMTIYLLGRRLFMVMEGPDDFEPRRDFSTLDSMHPRYREWQLLMDTLQEKVPEAQADEHWAQMERIFQLQQPER